MPLFQRVARHARDYPPTIGRLVALFALLGCDPRIESLDPPRGHDRTLVAVTTSPVYEGAFFWDPATPSEKWRAGGLLGQMFTVPGGATVGSHSVQRYYDGIRGSPVAFDVDEVRPFPKPRVDRVSLLAAEFSGAGSMVTTLLYVQGANVDVGAVIERKSGGTWVPMNTMAHRGISNRSWDVTWKIPYGGLGYPIYHHLALIGIPGAQSVPGVLELRITNEDGASSDAFVYNLPASPSTVDSDGDAIPDQVEDANGWNKFRPDILIEVDRMSGVRNEWSSGIGDALKEVFAAAPIINPFSSSGITVFIDDSQVIPVEGTVWYNGGENRTIAEGVCSSAIPTTKLTFMTLKRACFDNAARGQYWHYCVWAAATYESDSTSAGDPISTAEVGGHGEVLGDVIGGDDCIVAADYWYDHWMYNPTPPTPATPNVLMRSELLLHELGHNLGLLHGATDDARFNPTYNSVMTSSWLGRYHWLSPATRKKYPICPELYYQMAVATEGSSGTGVPAGSSRDVLHGFSDGMGRGFSENDLDERAESPGKPFGVCNNAVDWNLDGDFNDLNESRNFAGTDADTDTTDPLRDHPDWFRLMFNGPAFNGKMKLQSDPP